MVIQRWFYGGGMVILQRCSLQWRESGHVTEVASLREGEWSCYGGCHFNGGRKVMSEGQSWCLM